MFEEIVIDEGQLVLGWRDVPTDDRELGPSAVAVEPVFKQIFIGRAPGAPAPGASIESDAQFERKLYVIRKRIEHAIDAADLPLGREALLLRRQPVLEHVDLQGDADGGSDRDDVPGSDRSGDGVGARAGAPALQHQYISVVAARPPLPFCRPQRRDQYPARQHQLDEGARSAAALRRPRPRARARSCRSSARAGATRRSSTTSSSSW